MISDDEDADEVAAIQGAPKKNITDYWCEIFVDTEEKWTCVDLESGTWDNPNEIEKKSYSPLLYVVSWDNHSFVKDVSQRYCSEFASCKFRRSRIDDDWWTQTLSYFRPAKRSRQEKREDNQLAQIFADRPMPSSLSDFKNHPLYVLKKHLLKYEVIYPPDAPILGKFRNEVIYARECVKDVHSREYWMRQARVVRPNEEPYKISVKRKKWDKNLGDFLRDLPLELFGEWQTDPYIPPDAKDGKVPRNQYGNVELFQPCMLPGGTVYLQLPGLIRIANKLKIDCAPAVTGFDNCSGGAGVHPVFDGFVVCEEFADTLKAAWEEEQLNIKKREIAKREKRIYGNWRRLIRGVLIREQLKLKYSSRDDEPEDGVEMSERDEKSGVKSSMTMDDIDKALSMMAKKRSSRGSGQGKGKKSTKKETKAKSNKRRSRKKQESSDEEDTDEEEDDDDEDDFIVDDDEEIEEIDVKDEEEEIETEIDLSDSD
ncbi:DNA repair protein complementing XP-C cells homolog [Panonychus citri]|uniref:DNA repair protein complementing XP-C cells homolog n=1 Tax=Panonychus citri TaxID=50023 RepID=UPI0023073BEA|nr:DNA repair protein complementing XP-C cells homolog [Panonychus citri]